MLGALAVCLSGCTAYDALKLGWPNGITPQAHDNLKLWIGSLIAALVVGAIVYLLVFWVAAFHRKKATDTELPRQFGYNMPLEIVLTVIPFLIIAMLFYFTVIVQVRMEKLSSDPEVVVDVTSFQWNWKFGYHTVKFKDGTSMNFFDQARQDAMRAKPEGVDKHGQELVGAISGLDPEDRTYLNFDSIETVGTSDEIPVLVLPVHSKIRFVLASADVVHSFWVPEFLFKRDVLPNPHANHSENEFEISEIDRTGPFVGRCAELCGTYHSMMNFEVRVVDTNDFKQYILYRHEHPNATNAEALAWIKQPTTAITTHPFNTRRGQQSKTPS